MRLPWDYPSFQNRKEMLNCKVISSGYSSPPETRDALKEILWICWMYRNKINCNVLTELWDFRWPVWKYEYAVVQFYLEFKFYFLCYKLILIHDHNSKQRKIKFKSRKNWSTAYSYFHRLTEVLLTFTLRKTFIPTGMFLETWSTQHITSLKISARYNILAKELSGEE